MASRRPASRKAALGALLALLGACGSEPAGSLPARSLEPSVAVDLNRAPDVVEVKLVAEPAKLSYLPDGEAEVWVYRDAGNPGARATVPGPLIEADLGARIIIHFENRLPEGTTIHWHGMRVPNAFDGTPSTQMEVPPGGSFVYELIAEDAGTFWYHPHVRGDVQVERGLYGMLIVRGGPGIAVDADRAFVLDDVKLEASGRLSDKTESLDIMLGRQGNVLLVNGQEGGRIPAKSGARERWRFVNSANGRYFNLRLPGHRFLVVGWDGGLLPRPYDSDTLLITPGERYEVLVTLEGPPGSSLDLETIHYDRGHDIPDPGPKRLLTIVLGAGGAPPGPLPTTWGETPALQTSPDTAVRALVLDEVEASGAGEDPRFLINDKMFPEVPPIEARVGDVEVWSIENATEMDHPFHLHGMFFQVLDVSGEPPEHRGWKDTVNVPRKKTLRFAVRYGTAGRWMYHCHILEHAERGMMGELVLAGGN
jgi:FtsP/CotA-like multicopper oxidase with cupredoxin domain